MFWLFLIILALLVVVDQANPQQGSVATMDTEYLRGDPLSSRNKYWLQILSSAARSAQLS